MDNVGFIKTYEVTIVELDTKAETGMVVKAGEELSTGAFIIWCLLNDQEIVSTDDSYFVAFQHFRDKLLKAGYGIKCNGARLNVVPFSMIESSPKVHIVELGKSIRSDDYVNIWDKADINDFPDSREQNRFYDKWSRERKAIEERMERKAPIAIIILVLIPFITDTVSKMALYITNYVWDYRWGMSGVFLLLTNIGLMGTFFTISAGFLMEIIGTVMAIKQKKVLFITIGVITILSILFVYGYLFFGIFLIGAGFP